MKNFNFRSWSEISYGLGVGSGFLVFFLLQAIGFGWGVSFGVGFTLSFLISCIFNFYLSSFYETQGARDISKTVQEFEKK